MASAAQVRALLERTSLPSGLVDDLVGTAAPLWLSSEPAAVLAGDLALCHPPLAPGEVRAMLHPLPATGTARLGVVAADRVGLLAASTAALAAFGLSVISASATTWPHRDLALQRVIVGGGGEATPSRTDWLTGTDWDAVGEKLRSVLGRKEWVTPPFTPAPPVDVEAVPQGGGQTLVSIQAPDRIGLLWATARWFETHSCNIVVARAMAARGVGVGTFLVAGDVDGAALAAHLSGEAPSNSPAPADAAASSSRRFGRWARRSLVKGA